MGYGFEICKRCKKICMEGHQEDKSCDKTKICKKQKIHNYYIYNLLEKNGARYISRNHDDSLYKNIDLLCDLKFNTLDDTNMNEFKDIFFKVLKMCYGGCGTTTKENMIV
jgi:hypothetical protein